MNAATVRERYARIRDEVGPDVTVVAATKYVPLTQLGILAEAGVEVVGENRAQDLSAKHAEYGEAFADVGDIGVGVRLVGVTEHGD